MLKLSKILQLQKRKHGVKFIKGAVLSNFAAVHRVKK